ncbi:hypothetical protein POUND7_009741 [Theobroma cacao]
MRWVFKGELCAVACIPTDPVLVAAGNGDDRGFLWKIGHADWASELQGHTDSVSSLAFSNDGQCTWRWVRWHPKGHQILAGSEDYSVWMWNADNRCRLFSGHGASVTCGQPHHTEGLTCLSISSDSTFAVTGSKDGSVHIVNVTTGKEGVTCLAWLGASKFLATGCCDGRIRLWNCLSGKCVATLKGHQHAIQSLSVSSNLEFLVSVSIDGTARVFEIRHFH